MAGCRMNSKVRWQGSNGRIKGMTMEGGEGWGGGGEMMAL